MIDIENMSVLIVDDLKSMRTLLKKTLRHLDLGKEIYVAENGRDGLRVLEHTHIDLVIVDWKMPVMNGMQMLDAMRAEPLLRDMPVLMVTAEREKDVVYEVAEVEVDGFLLKPLTPTMLEEKIRQAVEKANDPDEATLLVRKARSLDEAEKLDMAIICQERAVALRPHASRLKRNLGILYGKAGKIEEMERCYLEAAADNLQDAVTRHMLSRFYWQKKQWSKAVKYSCEVLTLTNRFNDYALKAGQALLKMKQNELATTLFTKLVNKLDKHLDLKGKILDLCAENGEKIYARELLTQLLKDFPGNQGLQFKAGQIYEALGDSDKALEYLLEANKNGIEPIKTKLSIAQIYMAKEKILQADEFLAEVLRLDPENKEALELRRSM
ncbi:response regulator [uncultured Desulfobacter sp.]|uniref:response regulator n=1 Tax=uncultured Desulfobacter sp. TaxID=240139 RepID=UPI002AABD2B3|nr:response regulator [uncultured Desulfobacter sp.]